MFISLDVGGFRWLMKFKNAASVGEHTTRQLCGRFRRERKLPFAIETSFLPLIRLDITYIVATDVPLVESVISTNDWRTTFRTDENPPLPAQIYIDINAFETVIDKSYIHQNMYNKYILICIYRAIEIGIKDVSFNIP